MTASAYHYFNQHPDFVSNQDLRNLMLAQQAYTNLTKERDKWDPTVYNALRGSLDYEIRWLRENITHRVLEELKRNTRPA